MDTMSKSLLNLTSPSILVAGEAIKYTDVNIKADGKEVAGLLFE